MEETPKLTLRDFWSLWPAFSDLKHTCDHFLYIQ